MKKSKFWNLVRNEAGVSELQIRGPIDDQVFWGDEVTPKQFRDDIAKASGPLTVWINSPGGNVMAASEIYTALLNYPGKITVKIDGIAASAASVIAMAGSEVLMAPTAEMMIHNPSTIAIGDHNAMKDVIKLLDSIKQSIINAYEKKTGLSRDEISKLMDQTKWMDANEAMRLGFADGMIEKNEEESEPKNALFSHDDVTRIVEATEKNMITKLVAKYTPTDGAENKKTDSGKPGNEGEHEMFKTVEELTAACPELVKQIRDEAINEAVKNERARLKAIDEIVAMVGDEKMIEDARYGNPITAEALAHKALKAQAELAKKHLKDAKEDTKESKVDNVNPSPAPSTDEEAKNNLSVEDRIKAGREAAKKIKEAK